MGLYLLAIFLSAFLLFQVQPLIGKFLLPWFGGTAGVWTACLLFFQIALLSGYSYANLISSRFSRRYQAMWHLGVLGVSLLFLPFLPDLSWRPTGTESPTQHILLLLTIHIGVPFAVLSSIGPLLQSWFSQTFSGRSPYRLYDLSNAGLLLALVSYPFLVEPSLTLQTQALIWSWGYRVFVVLCGWCAWRFFLSHRPLEASEPEGSTSDCQSTTTAESDTSLRKADVLFWLLLAATGSAMLLATTNRICEDLAVVPLLWILPLAIYLITFILCFDHDWWYQRSIFEPSLAVSALAVVFIMRSGYLIVWAQIGVYAATLFVCCMTCHGELARSKPVAERLTWFYMIVAAGGALGGVSVTIAAPYVFKDYWEYHLVLSATVLLAIVCVSRDAFAATGQASARLLWRRRLTWATVAALVGCH